MQICEQGAPRAIGMHPWDSVPPNRLKTTEIDFKHPCIQFTAFSMIPHRGLKKKCVPRVYY